MEALDYSSTRVSIDIIMALFRPSDSSFDQVTTTQSCAASEHYRVVHTLGIYIHTCLQGIMQRVIWIDAMHDLRCVMRAVWCNVRGHRRGYFLGDLDGRGAMACM